jgi:SpoVK/Ycf46/Vps4 family AAA+-type ATPase
VGKTACAEGIASDLGKAIVVASYAEIQNLFVGETEKNITRVFRQAREEDAVLFWDEADAIFFDRDQASRQWEVREVNVLLEELERHPGLCVLATNRKVSLDPAVERRITIKVEFAAPDREMRREIWRKLLPPRMPLAPDVDLDALAEYELVGGEIKNVLLNAARLALDRSPRGAVRRSDFEAALEMDRAGRWGRVEAIGFRP